MIVSSPIRVPNIVVVSHSYTNDENMKNMLGLARLAPVRVIVPDIIRDPLFGTVGAGADTDLRTAYARLGLPQNQYLLKSLTLGMAYSRPDIVHIEYDPWTPIFWQALAAKRRHAPEARVFCTVKKNTYRPLIPPLGWAKRRLARRLARQVTHFFAVNHGVAQIYRDRILAPDASISALQHLGVDCDLFAPVARDFGNGPTVIGHCGRIDESKGVPDLIAAVEQVRASGHEVELRLLGAGPLAEPLRARRLPWLTVLDPVPHGDVAGFLAGLDLFVLAARILPDHEEHDGHAVMEAMACGLPVIGSSSGVIPELLGPDRGMIFPAGDVAALRDALLALAADPDRQSAYGGAARRYSLDQFSIDGIAQRKMTAYREALDDV